MPEEISWKLSHRRNEIKVKVLFHLEKYIKRIDKY